MRLLLLLALAPWPALAGDWVDTRLVFLFGDDDFMHDAGVTVPPSQRIDIGDRPGFDEFYDLRDDDEAGRESRTHLVLRKSVDGYFKGLTTEAALLIELNHGRMLRGDPRSLEDDGTYLRLTQRFEAGEFSFTALPFNSDVLRLGWLWDISWGGSGVFPSADIVPGFSLDWQGAGYDVMLGVKTARQTFVADPDDERSGQIEAFYGLMGGLGIGDREGGLRFELQGAFFEKARNERGPVRGERVDAAGVSTRLSYTHDLGFHQANDLRMYSAQQALRPWNHPQGQWGGLRWNLAAELTYLSQILEDPASSGGTVDEPGVAGAGYGTLVIDDTRIQARFIYRDLGFLFFNTAGVTPFRALDESVEALPELVATLQIAQRFPEAHLTPSLTLGVQRPAATSTTRPDAGIHAPEVLTGQRSSVFRRASMFDDTGLLTEGFLPEDGEVLPVFGARFATQLDLAAGFAVVADLVMLWDDNRVIFEQDVLGVNNVRAYDEPVTVGASVMVRAEF